MSFFSKLLKKPADSNSPAVRPGKEETKYYPFQPLPLIILGPAPKRKAKERSMNVS